MITEEQIDAQLALEAIGNNRYRRELSHDWTNATERIFGGYSAALALAAAAAAAPYPRLCSAHLLFLGPAVPGEITFETAALRVGRAVAAMSVTGEQHGRRVLQAQAWLGVSIDADTGGDKDRPVACPEDAVPLTWLQELYAFHRHFECRGVDYPASGRSLIEGDGRRSVDVWARAAAASPAPEAATQLWDVMVADAFSSDPQLRTAGLGSGGFVTLDLSIQWSPYRGRTGWRRLQAWSPPQAHSLSLCQATVFDESMNVCASVAQQTLTLPRSSRP